MIKNWTVKHVESLADLPENLTIGRAYFVDSEHYIIIDHGAGAVIYGNREGQRGIPGAPIPELQAQIDSLTVASLRQLTAIDDFNQRHKQAEAEIKSDVNAKHSELQNYIKVVDDRRVAGLLESYSQLQKLSEAIITLTSITSELADNLRGTEGTILKLLLQDEQSNPVTPLQQYDNITTTDGYSWKVTEVGEDGTLVFVLVDKPQD